MLVPAGPEDEVDDPSETRRGDDKDGDNDAEPVEWRRRAVRTDVRRVLGTVVRSVDVDRKEAGDDVEQEDGQTDQVQLDQANIGISLRVLEGEPEDREVRGVVVSEGRVVENEGLLHRDDMICEGKRFRGRLRQHGDESRSRMSTLTLQVSNVHSNIVFKVTTEERRVFLEDSLPKAADDIGLGAE